MQHSGGHTGTPRLAERDHSATDGESRGAKILHSGAFWTLTFALAILITQIGSLGTEVRNWDESTFVLLSAGLLDGTLPYVELFDVKPPMIFAMLSGAMAVFGETLNTVRLFGDVCIFVTCLATFGAARLWTDAVSAGLGILLLIAMISGLAQATMTELPAVALLMVALWLLLTRRDRYWAIATVGLLISLATLTRLNLGYVAVAFGLYLVATGFFLPSAGVRRWSIVPYVLAGLAPPAIIALTYWQAGALFELRLAVLDVPLSYAGGQADVLDALRHGRTWILELRGSPFTYGLFTAFTVMGIGLSLVGFARGGDSETPRRHDEVVLWLMLIAIVISVLMSGPAYSHYWLQFLPLCAIFCARAIAWMSGWARLRMAGVFLTLVALVAAAIPTAPSAFGLLTDPDYQESRQHVRDAARRIDEVRGEDDLVWALENHLIYWYLDVPPPSRVAVHPDNILRPSVLRPLIEAGYVPEGEFERLISERPTFVVTRTQEMPWFMRDRTDADYDAIWQEFIGDYDVLLDQPRIVVYQLRSG